MPLSVRIFTQEKHDAHGRNRRDYRNLDVPTPHRYQNQRHDGADQQGQRHGAPPLFMQQLPVQFSQPVPVIVSTPPLAAESETTSCDSITNDAIPPGTKPGSARVDKQACTHGQGNGSLTLRPKRSTEEGAAGGQRGMAQREWPGGCLAAVHPQRQAAGGGEDSHTRRKRLQQAPESLCDRPGREVEAPANNRKS